MTDQIPVFVNGRLVMLARGGTAADAAAQAGAGAPTATLTDARGLPVPPDEVLVSGAILRVVASARRAGGVDADS